MPRLGIPDLDEASALALWLGLDGEGELLKDPSCSPPDLGLIFQPQHANTSAFQSQIILRFTSDKPQRRVPPSAPRSTVLK